MIRLWFGKRGWGWRLWGVSKGDKWFVGLSIKAEDTTQGDSENRYGE